MEFTIQTSKSQQIIDITKQVQNIVSKSQIKKGICNIFALHATAGIIINENYDPNICTDFLNAINKIIPDKAGYLHDKIDGNGGAHIKSALIGPSETVQIKDSKLILGTWQSIMLVDLDGPKKRTIRVEIIGK